MESASRQNFSLTSSSDPDSSPINDAPLWRHVVKLDKAPGGGGNRSFKCNFCNNMYNGSYSRVKAHLLKIKGQGIRVCARVDFECLQQLQKEQEIADNKKAIACNRAAPSNLPLLAANHGFQIKKRKMDDEEISPQMFDTTTRDELDKKAARFFYSSALPFNLARSPYWRDFVTSVANSNCQGYSPPNVDKLRFTLLKEEKAHIERTLDSLKFSWGNTGVSIVSDGWTDDHQGPLINFMAISVNGPFFLKAVEASERNSDPKYLTRLFIELINQVGPNRVVQIVTDNTLVCKAASINLESRYPHVFWTPCVVHALNLALKNISSPDNGEENSCRYEKCKWIADIDKNVRSIKDFVVHNEFSPSFYMKYSQLKLLRVAETKFASTIVLVKRIKMVREALTKMIADADWEIYATNDNEKAQIVKNCATDETWWDKIDYILEFTEPIVNMMRIANREAGVLPRVCEMWDTMLEQVQATIFRHEKKDFLIDQSEFFNVIRSILVSKWDKNDAPLVCLAHSLNPKYYSHAWLRGAHKRIAPYQDEEISKNRIFCFRRLFDNRYQLRQIQNEFGKFATGAAPFDQLDMIQDRDGIDSLSWWANYGAGTPLLQSLALKLLSHPASSSCCVRNWNTYSMIHDMKRKFSSAQVEDLVYVHSNLRLLSRKKDQYLKGPTKYWDVIGEDIDIEGQPDIDVANLTLGDPVLDPMIFDDEEQDDAIEMLNMMTGAGSVGTSGSIVGGDEATEEDGQ